MINIGKIKERHEKFYKPKVGRAVSCQEWVNEDLFALIAEVEFLRKCIRKDSSRFLHDSQKRKLGETITEFRKLLDKACNKNKKLREVIAHAARVIRDPKNNFAILDTIWSEQPGCTLYELLAGSLPKEMFDDEGIIK